MLAAMLDEELDLVEAASAGCPRNEVYRARLRIRELFDGEE